MYFAAIADRLLTGRVATMSDVICPICNILALFELLFSIYFFSKKELLSAVWVLGLSIITKCDTIIISLWT